MNNRAFYVLYSSCASYTADVNSKFKGKKAFLVVVILPFLSLFAFFLFFFYSGLFHSCFLLLRMAELSRLKLNTHNTSQKLLIFHEATFKKKQNKLLQPA